VSAYLNKKNTTTKWRV